MGSRSQSRKRSSSRKAKKGGEGRGSISGGAVRTLNLDLVGEGDEEGGGGGGRLVRNMFWLVLVGWLATVGFAGMLYSSTTLQRGLVFLHFVVWPLPTSLYTHLDYTFGESAVGKYSIENVGVESGEGNILLKGFKLRPPLERGEGGGGGNTIIFFHGNAASRALSWRKTHVKLLADAGATVYAFDLRGYGDVEGTPTEEGVTEDARTIFDHVRRAEAGKSIFVYGHSLGTAIASALVNSVCKNPECIGPGKKPAISGIMLDSPFVNATFAALHHPSTLLIRLAVPYADQIIRNSLEIKFPSDEYLGRVDVPLTIIQGLQDKEINIEKAGGLVLVESVRKRREKRRGEPAKEVKIKVYERTGHENVHENSRFLKDINAALTEGNSNERRSKIINAAAVEYDF
ncbi:hypothetical protein TrCOL_g3860 [Triparma columacea]|uniref:AB hydrolase-1 domain-containing protein n=1 Tax=Triparma columacea TaxID=722753 RepID=A0A9W7LB29_9STRA|nr:hypothetical protein TrCOL_g3860 [Triparma columacea]